MSQPNPPWYQVMSFLGMWTETVFTIESTGCCELSSQQVVNCKVNKEIMKIYNNRSVSFIGGFIINLF